MSTAYIPPAFPAPIDLDLSRNEGRPRIAEISLSPDELAMTTSRYPDTTSLREVIASRHGVGVDSVLVTAGGDDALFRSILAARGGLIAATTPSFEMIRRYADQSGSPVREVPWWAREFPVEEFVSSKEAVLGIVVSPNNPTGNVVDASRLAGIASAFPLIVLDAAYEEFADQELTPAALDLGNVVVTRTLSKAYGLAGLRVGYALGPVEVISKIAAFGSPFAVSSLSAALAVEVLSRRDGLLSRYLAAVTDERGRLIRLLRELGCAPLSSQANFVLATDVDAVMVVDEAAGHGVGVRRFPGRDDLARCVRITLPGDESEYRRLETTLRAVLTSGRSKGRENVA